jgi:predicted RNase H-like HicB family nuclease
MFSFEEYTLVIYETSKDYYADVPEHRFVAYLLEIPETSLHAYGDSRENALNNLNEQFQQLAVEAAKSNVNLPEPHKRDLQQFSGKIVLRMPPWLHQAVVERAEHDGSSLNTYVVNRLVKATTMEEMVERLCQEQASLINQLSYKFEMYQERTKLTKKSASPFVLIESSSVKYKEVA